MNDKQVKKLRRVFRIWLKVNNVVDEKQKKYIWRQLKKRYKEMRANGQLKESRRLFNTTTTKAQQEVA